MSLTSSLSSTLLSSLSASACTTDADGDGVKFDSFEFIEMKLKFDEHEKADGKTSLKEEEEDDELNFNCALLSS